MNEPEPDFMPGAPHGRSGTPRRSRPGLWLAAAAAVALFAVSTARDAQNSPPFATLETAHSAHWGSGDLPTREGSRLGPGRLRLEEGLAAIRFDSGVKVSLRTGQRASVDGQHTGPVSHGFDERFQARRAELFPEGPGWMLLETSKDTCIGDQLQTDSELLLCVKHGTPGFHRKAYDPHGSPI